MSSVHFLLLQGLAYDGSITQSGATTMVESMLSADGYSYSRSVIDEDLATKLSHADAILLEVRDSRDLALCESVRRMSRLPLILYGEEVPLTIWIKGLQAGCDSYIALPGSETVLRAQIRALLRRNNLDSDDANAQPPSFAGRT